MLLMIDNYDSFTYNLVQYFGELGQAVEVYRNDEITIQGIEKLKSSNIERNIEEALKLSLEKVSKLKN